MNPSEPKQPGEKPDELCANATGKPAVKNPLFPEFARLEGEEEFETVDYRHCESGWYVDLETTYITKRIWEQSRLALVNWRTLSELEALTVAQFSGDLTIEMPEGMGPESQMEICRVVAEHKGMLFLFGYAKLTEDAATALLQHPGPLVIDVKLDFHTAYILGTRLLDIQIISDWWEA